MKTRAILLGLVLCTAAFGAGAQTLFEPAKRDTGPCIWPEQIAGWPAADQTGSAAFVLAVTNISIPSVSVGPSNVVSFLFVDPRAVNADDWDYELKKNSMRSKRPVYIMDDTTVVAEARLFGRFWGIRANGFMLRFATAPDAQAAAEIMQQKGAWVLPKQSRNPRAETVY